ncbi:unnamed protein product [Schistocephalus solidus]|uniref:EF-hand domain-containing protein n=1 Tax=Schistocephalus solidus TaxID=70667 RepID=A0A183T8F9_SCHSO|nr:unnamed protein product [Schistocephalus solidus]
MEIPVLPTDREDSTDSRPTDTKTLSTSSFALSNKEERLRTQRRQGSGLVRAGDLQRTMLAFDENITLEECRELIQEVSDGKEYLTLQGKHSYSWPSGFLDFQKLVASSPFVAVDGSA